MGALARRARRPCGALLLLALALRGVASSGSARVMDALAWRARTRACADVAAVVRRWTGEGRARGHVACFVGRASRRTVAHEFVAVGERGLNVGYLRGALRFLRDAVEVGGEGGGGGAGRNWRAVWALEDDASWPREFVRELRELGVFVLAHSVEVGSVSDEIVFVPNFHFIKKRGFETLIEKLGRDERAFEDRENVVFWRGSTTGVVRSAEDDADVGRRDGRGASTTRNDELCARLPRVRAALLSNDAPWLDVAITRRVQVCKGHRKPELSIASRAPESSWIEHKGILEIDGNVDAWGNRWRMESGSVVFLVQSSFKHYYSDKLKDGVHYIGIAPDLSDLVEKTRLVTRSDAESVRRMRDIARNARELMRELTYDRVVEDVAARLFGRA